ncbi:UDP-N-acetylmuramoyl-tripeptide--D-alanyl-D-alanine ligase [Carboxydocella sp. ULO1]|uniref:UDP-N-acetylmuramoyl-tripeptide--D-alanyl-D- alanine ligase n=1 Tax=Carboxydocella sp. ULO1 TaxID=1926599 RepID=UPI0009CECF2A|nr:UDP-N-acetylmuramoyl-tripeptide--D-alanyl-D-alanine ligase [Carboxydocella sp. ULO1]GAW28795.1 UDP-N-acetylmuramoyl-tripeptide--D-alanyl-D-alanine ligase [Carboxydocella sp. ULO1]
MLPLTLAEIASAVQGELKGGQPETVISEVVTDSRRVQPGQLFIALVGEKHDAHSFLPQVASAGAEAAIVSRLPAEALDLPLILVKDTLVALQQLAAYVRQRWGGKVVAVTGSVGKTSTKDLLVQALGSSWSVRGTQGNLNNEIGLPLTILSLTGQEEILVTEMGMRGPGQIATLADIARPDLGIITNIGDAHIELLGSREAIARAKGELLYGLKAGGRAILWGDDPYLRRLGQEWQGDVIWYGRGEDCHFRLTSLQLEAESSRFQVLTPVGPLDLTLPLPGEAMVNNALAALAAVWALGGDVTRSGAALAQARLSGMRLEKKEIKGAVIRNDAYNANPQSMAVALAILARQPGEKVAVLGDMLELGPIEEEAHRQLGREAGRMGLAFLLTIGPRARWIAEEAARAGLAADRIRALPGREGAAGLLKPWLRPGVTILFKASRGMGLEKIIGELEQEETMANG